MWIPMFPTQVIEFNTGIRNLVNQIFFLVKDFTSDPISRCAGKRMILQLNQRYSVFLMGE